MKKVLVVDDDPDAITNVRILLDRHGFLVESSTKGKTLFKNIKEFEPGLIILDVLLEDADGRDLCKEIKQNPETKHIPIILFSGDHKFINEFKECNADGFIGKPFQPSMLVKVANKYF